LDERLSLEEVTNLFVSSVESGWFYIKRFDEFSFGKLEESENFSQPQVSYLFTINKITESISLFRYGECLDCEKLAGDDFDVGTKTLKKTKSNTLHFIKTLKELAVDHCTATDVLRVCQSMIDHSLKKSEESSSQTIQNHETALRFINEELKMITRTQVKYSPAIIRYGKLVLGYFFQCVL
jgi:hypothetical protein